MIRTLSIFSLTACTLALAACGDKGDGDTSGNEDSCPVEQVTSFPEDDSVTAYYRGAVEFNLVGGGDMSATIESDIDGTVSSNEDGTKWTLTPSAALTPSTSYSATLHYCGGDATINFITSELGTAMSDESILVGKSYQLALSDARIVQPENVGDLLSQYLDVTILIGVDSINSDAGKIQMLGALGVDGVTPPAQDFCNPSIDFPEADFADAPHFVIGGEGTTDITVAGITVSIDNLNISGDFAPDGSYFGGGVLSGSIDTRPLDTLVSEDAEEGYICNLAAGLGIQCEECPSGGAFCLSLLADSIVATEVEGLTLMEQAGNNCTSVDDADTTTLDCATWTAATVPAAEDQVCEE
jgi:hypothetical protein